MNLATLLELPAAIMPQHTALIDQTERSYGWLQQNAAEVADCLTQLGLVPGMRLALMQQVSDLHVAVLFAALARGLEVALINYRSRSEELQGMLSAREFAMVVVDDRYVGTAAEAIEALPSSPALLTTAALSSRLAERNDAAARPMLQSLDMDETATGILLFTSGTTGIPKPVTLTHASILGDVLQGSRPPAGISRGRTLLAAPSYHIAGLKVLLTNLYSGHEVSLLRDFDPDLWLQRVAEQRIGSAFVVPTMLRRILRSPFFDQTDLSSLRLLSYGAAPTSPALIEEALERFPVSCDFINAFGQTETRGTITQLLPADHRPSDPHADPQTVRARLRSVGRPIPGVSVAVLNIDDSPTQQPEVVGEVVVCRSAGTPAGEWLRTGDRGYLDSDGYLFLVGRNSDLIIRGGENVDPVEVERVLDLHPDVEESAVIGCPDEEWGEVITAFVVPARGAAVDPQSLRVHAKRHLASFKAPEKYIVTSELPRNSVGKVSKLALREELNNHVESPN